MHSIHSTIRCTIAFQFCSYETYHADQLLFTLVEAHLIAMNKVRNRYQIALARGMILFHHVIRGREKCEVFFLFF